MVACKVNLTQWWIRIDIYLRMPFHFQDLNSIEYVGVLIELKVRKHHISSKSMLK